MTNSQQFKSSWLRATALAGLCAVLMSGNAEACNGSPYVRAYYEWLTYSMADRTDIIVAGRVVVSDPEARTTKIEVTKTYKGRSRKSWTFAWPKRDFAGNDKTSDLVASRHVIVAAKWDTPNPSYLAQPSSGTVNVSPQYLTVPTAKNDRVRLEPIRIVKFSCKDALVFDYSQRLDTRLSLAFQPGERAAEALRERILRRAFAFGHFFTARPDIKDALRNGNSMFRRLDVDKDGTLRSDEIPTLEIAEKRHLYRRWFRAEALKNVNQAVRLFDENRDDAMSKGELEAAIRRAFSLYDTNGNGIVDDFETGRQDQ